MPEGFRKSKGERGLDLRGWRVGQRVDSNWEVWPESNNDGEIGLQH